METKVCKRCGIEKTLDQYNKRNTCNKCEYEKRYLRKLKQFEVDPESKEKDRLSKIKSVRNKEATQPIEAFSQAMRSAIRKSFSRMGINKNYTPLKILGMGWVEFFSYFEKLFKEGMSWDNYGEWQIDHIVPVSIARNEDDMIKLNHYTNFQPLWRKENRDKSNKILEEHKVLLYKLLGDDFIIE